VGKKLNKGRGRKKLNSRSRVWSSTGGLTVAQYPYGKTRISKNPKKGRLWGGALSGQMKGANQFDKRKPLFQNSKKGGKFPIRRGRPKEV